jgi:hypothetical protein
MRLASVLLAASLTACCAGSPPPDAPGAVNAPAAEEPPAGANTSTAAAPLVGRWSSPSCGKRTYPRLVAFAPTGTFMAEDRVSPCPPGTVCVWAGIVFHRGRYTTSAGTITLTLEGPQGHQGEPMPASMSLDASGAPVETGTDGQACVYAAVKP